MLNLHLIAYVVAGALLLACVLVAPPAFRAFSVYAYAHTPITVGPLDLNWNTQ